MEMLLSTLKWSLVVGAAALALAALKPFLDRRYSAKWRYRVWLVLAVLLLLAPAQWGELLPQIEAPAPAVVLELPQVELAVSREDGVRFQRPGEGTVLPSAPGTAHNTPTAEQAFSLDEFLPILWLAGAAAFLLYHLLGTFLLQQRAKRWSRAPGEAVCHAYSEVRREMGLRNAPPLRISSRVDSPMLTGLFRPCLLLPEDNLRERELRFILRHELTHYRRHDLWYKFAVLLANSLHWFNPLVYLLSREASRDMELTCDALVVAGADAEARRAYSETLLASVHRQKGFTGRSALSTHFYGGAEVMKERFRNILGKQGRKWGVIALALTLLATLVTACAVGVSQAAGPAELGREELDVWQEKLLNDPDMAPYLFRMYTDPAHVPSEELLDSLLGPGSSTAPDFTILSGIQDGETVTLELEGRFSSELAKGTLTLTDGKPVSLTTPLYAAVEKMAWDYVNRSTISGQDAEVAERCITNLFCSDTFELDSKRWYIWELAYWLKPADISQVTLVGGMEERNGWVSDFYNAPILIISEDAGGAIVLEETAAQHNREAGYTWQDYVFCHLLLGMDMDMVLSGWPEITAEFLQSQQNGHQAGFNDWEDVARTYIEQLMGTGAGTEGLTVRYTAQAEGMDYDESMVVRTAFGDYSLTLLLTHVVYDGVSFWQVNGTKWEPEEPAIEPEEDAAESSQARELTAEELAYFANDFNPMLDKNGIPRKDSLARNGLLRFPYENFDGIRHYLEILFYDAGENVTDEAERAALEERMNTPIEVDCTKLTKDFIREFLTWNFAEDISDEDMTRLIEEDLSLPNLPDYDAFYLVHGDTMVSNYTFSRGVMELDGTVRLYYTTDLYVYEGDGELSVSWDQPMCVSLRLIGNDIWGVISNVMVQE